MDENGNFKDFFYSPLIFSWIYEMIMADNAKKHDFNAIMHFKETLKVKQGFSLTTISLLWKRNSINAFLHERLQSPEIWMNGCKIR